MKEKFEKNLQDNFSKEIELLYVKKTTAAGFEPAPPKEN